MDQRIRSLAVLDETGKQIKVKVDEPLLPSQAQELAQWLLALASDIIEKEASGMSPEERKWGTGHYPLPPNEDGYEE